MSTPLIDKVRTAKASGGLPIGEAIGKKHVVRFPNGGFSSHSLIVGRAQTGKTTLMAHLAAGRMREGRSLIVIDAEGDLITSLLALVPPDRVEDVVYIDLGDGKHPIGINPLEVSPDRSPQRIEDAVLAAARRAWPKDWDMEADGLMTAALRTLLAANEVLAQGKEPQFTMLDLALLFEYPGFRKKILHTYVHDPLLIHWWMTFYEELQMDRHLLLLASLFNPLHILSMGEHCRAFLAQSTTTVDFRKVLKEGKILLVKTNTAPHNDKGEAFLRAYLLDQILFTARELRANEIAPSRDPLPIFVHSHEPFIFPLHEGALADLEVEGITFVISMQHLSYFDQDVPHLSEHLIATRPNLLVFATIAEDARKLELELEHVVPWQALHNLSDWECFFRPRVEERFLPIERMRTLTPVTAATEIAEKLKRNSRAYIHAFDRVQRDRERFTEKWYGAECRLLHERLDPDFGLKSHSEDI